MSAATVDEVVSALVELGAELHERVRVHNHWTAQPAINGEEALGILASALLSIAKRLRDGEFGP